MKLAKKRLKFEHVIGTLSPQDIAKGFRRIELKGHTKPITCCRFVPLKKMLVSAAKDGSILVCKFSC